MGTIGLVILLFMVIVALLAPVLATHDVNKQRLVKRLKGPSAEYLLGTDSYGRDFYSRLIYGARISLSVGLGGSLVAVVIASLVGGLSGYFWRQVRHGDPALCRRLVCLSGIVVPGHLRLDFWQGFVRDHPADGSLCRHHPVHGWCAAQSLPSKRYPMSNPPKPPVAPPGEHCCAIFFPM